MKQAMIVGLLIADRIKESGRTQNILSKYAHLIRSRMGFHEVTSEVCSRVGIIMLQLTGQPSEWKKMLDELKAVGGLEVKTMSFEL